MVYHLHSHLQMLKVVYYSFLLNSFSRFFKDCLSALFWREKAVFVYYYIFSDTDTKWAKLKIQRITKPQRTHSTINTAKTPIWSAAPETVTTRCLYTDPNGVECAKRLLTKCGCNVIDWVDQIRPWFLFFYIAIIGTRYHDHTFSNGVYSFSLFFSSSFQ